MGKLSKQEFMDYFHAHDTCSTNMGICLIDMGEGTATATLSLTDSSRNVMGALHGGALATLADIAAGCCIYYRGRMCVTLDTDVRYLRGVRSGTVTATATERHSGGRVSVISVDILDEDGQLCCTASISMYLLDTPVEQIYSGREGNANQNNS